jgi:hypothetical protein
MKFLLKVLVLIGIIVFSRFNKEKWTTAAPVKHSAYSSYKADSLISPKTVITVQQ